MTMKLSMVFVRTLVKCLLLIFASVALAGAEEYCISSYGVEDARRDIEGYLIRNASQSPHMYRLFDLSKQVTNIVVEEGRMKGLPEWQIYFDFENGCGVTSRQNWVKLQCEQQLGVPGTLGECKS
jgi:hypothetical protein